MSNNNVRPFFIKAADGRFYFTGTIRDIHITTKRDRNQDKTVPAPELTGVTIFGGYEGSGTAIAINAPIEEVKRAFTEHGYDFVEFPLPTPAKIKTSLTPR